VIFLLGLPLYVSVLRPQADLAYHLGQPKAVTVTPESWAERAEGNAHVVLEAEVDPTSVHGNRRLLVGDPKAVTFQVKGGPADLILAVTAGPVYAAFLPVLNRDGDVGGALPDDFPRVFEGRVYRERSAFGEFATWFHGKDAALGAYMRRRGIPRADSTPAWLNRLSGRPDPGPGAWLLVVGEVPSVVGLADTNLPVFGLGLILGIAGLGWFTWSLGRRESRTR